jgi:hypothetical protein
MLLFVETIFALQVSKKRTPGAKALISPRFYGTAKPVPFVQRRLPSLHYSHQPAQYGTTEVVP